MPAEWEPQEACWLAWPSHADLWGEEELARVQTEFVELCRAISFAPSGKAPEKLRVLVPNSERMAQAKARLQGLPVEFFEIPFGDIWLRDTGPLFLQSAKGPVVGCFRFNGWGGKYNLPHDPQVSRAIASVSKGARQEYDWILEGGSIEVDGEGTCLTSEQCLLNPNRNPSMSKSDIEGALSHALGVDTVLWVKDGLLNDHTDGHIDTIVRFTEPGHVVCMKASGSDDPNAAVLDAIAAELGQMTDARDRKLTVHRIPSPGRVLDGEGEVMPASYVNFYISNHSVIVPTYGTPYDTSAVAELGRLFAGRRILGLSAKALLEGGGAFHCITQQQPTADVLGRFNG